MPAQANKTFKSNIVGNSSEPPIKEGKMHTMSVISSQNGTLDGESVGCVCGFLLALWPRGTLPYAYCPDRYTRLSRVHRLGLARVLVEQHRFR